MVITEVRIKLVEQNAERLLAFCSITFDNSFVVRDLKLIEGARGFFVAMPSRKLTDRCQKCHGKNHLRAKFCNNCGGKLDDTRTVRDGEGRSRLHADIAHPIHGGSREKIESAIRKSYLEEKEKSKLPGYVCRYDEYDAGDYEDVPSSYGHLVKAHGPHEVTPKSSHLGNSVPTTKTKVA
jgi:stage V sporulation protein G